MKNVNKGATNNAALRALPSVDALLRTDTARELLGDVGADKLTALAREVTDDLRRELIADSTGEAKSNGDAARAQLLSRAERELAALHRRQKASGVRRVINATGVVLHTNLG